MGRRRVTPAQAGALGQWAYDQRQRKGWSDEEAVALLFQKEGIRKSASTLRTLESGHYTPAPDVLAALERLYGSKAPRVPKETDAPPSEALRASVDAMEARLAGVEAALDRLATALRAASSEERARR